jgi:hypothetical protein
MSEIIRVQKFIIMYKNVVSVNKKNLPKKNNLIYSWKLVYYDYNWN